MKYLYILLFLFSGLTLSAQTFSITGTVKDISGNAVSNAGVSLKNTGYSTRCDSTGNFILTVTAGNYDLVTTAVGYKTASRTFKVAHDLTVNIILAEDMQQLKTVDVNSVKQKTFGITHLKSVEGTTINAGKKSEVIVLDDITANKSTNNTRQIYAKVAGLNIWESDGAGIQLGIGGRGLNPNRVTNFNTRQNGYDISADALGYPESYYTPPAELTSRIEILRGASSLQYGTQFGGIINFKLREGAAGKPIEITANETAGSWNFFNTSTSIGGTVKKLRYYAYYQHKQGDGWRPNGHFNDNTAYTSITYSLNNKLDITIQYTYMQYLAHQPGGLTDAQFATDPRQSIRTRNWFKVNWNLGAMLLDYKISDNLKFNSRFFGLYAGRDAVGSIDYSNTIDYGGDRKLYRDKYKNYGNESRLLYTYNIGGNLQNLLVGARYYHGHTDRQQGFGNNGSTGTSTDFDYGTSTADLNGYSHYNFPNYNLAFFAENIFRITPKLSIIPGVRFENIVTKAAGSFSIVNTDQSGNVIYRKDSVDNKNSTRHFLIAGLGLSYYQSQALQFYGNISQNYRAINFNDLNSSVKGLVVDPNLKDETGYSADLGVRGNIADIFDYDLSLFAIHYNNRIGSSQANDASFNTFRYRTNIGASRNVGLESFAELELLHFITDNTSDTRLSLFSNLALINAKYTVTKGHAFDGKKVEFAPDVVFKSGLTYRQKKFTASYQAAYTSQQFGDATNALTPAANAIIGPIPAYAVMDLSASYKLNKIFTLQGSCNNLTDKRYFTRRAESYPGPGIIPSDARGYYLTLQVKL
ncbi:TonB-dependent receptor [Mucilaginibacter sp. UR6-11]|uniref:TonB-dependent receptor n=1 Tax=Mucilaginibacter sp. UR6-11 TaxID=1435644 RepID=UPI001E389B4A|nr:TonB-dependent receptor [Mucilaginibacter sp. UR6-11]MCC8424303.1 TonB-dependent receptor [Mucilaginibacter sp. UR6-11]